MKIATKLKMAALVPALLALVISFALYFSYNAVQEAQSQDRAAQRIITGMNHLSSLISEYILYHEERPPQQFLVEHDSIMQIISGIRFSDKKQQKTLDSIRRDVDSMKGSFLKLVSNHERYGSAGSIELNNEVENRLAGRLLVWASDVVSEASYLERLIDENLTTTQKKTSLLIFGLIIATTLFLTIVLMGMMRNIAMSLMMLRKGTEVIGAGNLDHRIGLPARDEIGELSQSFDRMTEHLQAVTVSKNMLQKEVEERKKVEAALREQREWLQVTLNSIGDAVITSDTEGRITFLNPIASTLTGWPLEEAQGRPIQNVLRTINEVTRGPAEDIVKRVLTEGFIINMANHTALLHRDGTEIPIEDSAAPIFDAAEQVIGAVLVFHDVTERRRAEEELRTTYSRLQTFFDHRIGGIGIVIANAKGSIVQANDYYLSILGTTREELLSGQVDWRRMTPPEWLPVDERALDQLRERGVCDTYEKEYVRRDGARVPVLITDAMMPGDTGDILAFVLDITERKAAEEALRQSEQRYKSLHAELELRVRERTAELERRNRELREFAFVASHDLSEPLRKIQTFGSLLELKNVDRLDEQSRDYISRMTGAANRMRELLNALLWYSRIDTKGQEFRSAKLDDVVTDATVDLEGSIQKAGAQVEIGPLPTVNGDPYQLRQLFQNLIANAVKYHRAGVKPVIKVHGESDDGKCCIFVEDNGIGFDEKYLEKIFQPFQRLHGKDEYQGTGIGLAICRKIVERHGGTITANSNPGRGSTFIITLPLKQGEP